MQIYIIPLGLHMIYGLCTVYGCQAINLLCMEFSTCMITQYMNKLLVVGIIMSLDRIMSLCES